MKNTLLVRRRVRTLNFSRKNFQMYKELVGEICWDVLRSRKHDQSWQTLKEIFLGAEDLSKLTCKKPSKVDRKPPQISRDLLLKLRSKRKTLPVGAGTDELGRVQGHCLDM